MEAHYVHSTPQGDALIARMARVSNPSNANNDATAPRLIRYLIRHKHWSPFEMTSLCIRIETTRDIAAQILRHRSFSFQEFSQRYAEAPRPIVPSLRRQAAKNRQSSTPDLPERLTSRLTFLIRVHFHLAYSLYKLLLRCGVARENARSILPLHTPTTLYMHGTVRSWIHYISLRTHPDTQPEHRAIAHKVCEILQEVYPDTYVACKDEQLF